MPPLRGWDLWETGTWGSAASPQAIPCRAPRWISASGCFIRRCHTLDYIRHEAAKHPSHTHDQFEDVVAGRQPLAETELLDDERVLDLVRQAIDQIPSPRDEIQEAMGMGSYGYFRKVKCEAMKALRSALEEVLKESVESIL